MEYKLKLGQRKHLGAQRPRGCSTLKFSSPYRREVKVAIDNATQARRLLNKRNSADQTTHYKTLVENDLLRSN